jgi:Tfp pilus assembly protein PilO
MLSSKLILFIIAMIIVISLAAYAFHLQHKVKTLAQEKQDKDEAERALAQQNLDKRNNSIITDIRFIAQSLIAEQCEMTEAVLRIHHLADALDSDLMLQEQFSTIHQHFIACKAMAIKEAYKELPKKLRFQQDQQRFRLEESNKSPVLAEARLIIEYSFANLKNLH